jgi:gas vesicle protein
MYTRNNQSGFFLNFLTGTVIGGLIAFLFAPKSGEQLRNDLENDLKSYLEKVKTAGNKIIEEANQLAALTNKYAEGSFKESFGKVEKEISSVKNAIHAAVDTYKNYYNKSENSSESIADDIFIDFVTENANENIEDYELLPQHEGMKRRHDKKYF